MKNTIKIGTNLLELDKPIIMGILNVTPDSFYKDSRFNPNGEAFLKKAKEMIDEGVSIIDIGGYSTRPNGDFVSEQEEIERIAPAIENIRKNFPKIPISIDTFRAEVAEVALSVGAHIINDISGGDFDSKMLDLVLKKNVPYILMHLQGNFQNMHSETTYNDFYQDILNSLFKKANALRSKGLKDIILDPGFGFSKTIEQNYDLLKNLSILQNDHYPILAGMSRKSMIYKKLSITPTETLPFSMYLHSYAIQEGARIVRVHDVSPTYQLLKLTNSR